MSRLADRALGLIAYLSYDAESDALRDGLVGGILDPAERLSLIAHGDESTPAIAAVTDPQYAPLWALPAAAQWTGGVIPARRAGEDDDAYLQRARAEVLHPRSMLAGGPSALIVIAQGLLTGTRLAAVATPAADNEADARFWDIFLVVRAGDAADLAAIDDALNDDEVIAAGYRAAAIATDSPLIEQGEAVIEDVDVVIEDVAFGDVGDTWTAP